MARLNPAQTLDEHENASHGTRRRVTGAKPRGLDTAAATFLPSHPPHEHDIRSLADSLAIASRSWWQCSRWEV
jgi:hypothetical protein